MLRENKIHLVNFYQEQRLTQYPTVLSLGTARLGARLLTLNQRPKLFSISAANQDNADKVIDGSPNILGFSLHYWDRQLALTMLALSRQNGFRGDILIGGPEAKNIKPGVDFQSDDHVYIFPDEGEIPIEAYLSNRDEVIDPTAIQAIIWNASLDQRLKTLPTAVPLFSADFNEMYTSDHQRSSTFTWYDTARGCPYLCGYCDHGRGRRKPVIYPAETLEAEVSAIGNRFQDIFIIDPILGGGSKQSAKERLAMFNRLAKNTKLSFYLRPETVDQELIRLIQESNVSNIYIGIQTTNPDVPHWLRQNNQKALMFLEELSRVAPVTIELIIGLPGDTFQGLKSSLAFVAEHIRPKNIMAYPLTVLDGTPLSKIVTPTTGSNRDMWVARDDNFRATASSSYTNRELVKMIAYAQEFVAIYNQG